MEITGRQYSASIYTRQRRLLVAILIVVADLLCACGGDSGSATSIPVLATTSDTTRPTVTIVSPSGTTYISPASTLSLAGTAMDNVGLERGQHYTAKRD